MHGASEKRGKRTPESLIKDANNLEMSFYVEFGIGPTVTLWWRSSILNFWFGFFFFFFFLFCVVFVFKRGKKSIIYSFSLTHKALHWSLSNDSNKIIKWYSNRRFLWKKMVSAWPMYALIICLVFQFSLKPTYKPICLLPTKQKLLFHERAEQYNRPRYQKGTKCGILA